MADTDPALEEGQDNPERPEWLPENFKTPEDLLSSYKESQRKITEQAQQLRSQEESISTLSDQWEQFQAQQNQPDPNEINAYWEEQIATNPLQAMAAIAEASAQQALKQYQQQSQPGIKPEEFAAYVAENTVSAKYQDFGDLRDKISEEIQSNPLYHNDSIWVNPDLATRALTEAYTAVKAREVLAGNDVAQQQLADTRAMKLQAQSAVGASGRPEPASSDADEWARIRAAAPKRYYE